MKANHKVEAIKLLATGLMSTFVGCTLGSIYENGSLPTMGNFVVSTLGTLTTSALVFMPAFFGSSGTSQRVLDNKSLVISAVNLLAGFFAFKK